MERALSTSHFRPPRNRRPPLRVNLGSGKKTQQEIQPHFDSRPLSCARAIRRAPVVHSQSQRICQAKVNTPEPRIRRHGPSLLRSRRTPRVSASGCRRSKRASVLRWICAMATSPLSASGIATHSGGSAYRMEKPGAVNIGNTVGGDAISFCREDGHIVYAGYWTHQR
jgi:hypothetical protein